VFNYEYKLQILFKLLFVFEVLNSKYFTCIPKAVVIFLACLNPKLIFVNES
jgi:hypothetical protein